MCNSDLCVCNWDLCVCEEISNISALLTLDVSSQVL